MDDDSGYYQTEISTGDWDWQKHIFLKDMVSQINSQNLGVRAALDGDKITVTGWTMPSGYKWAPDSSDKSGLSDKYLIAPDGKVVLAPAYAQATCDNAFALQNSRESLATFVAGLNLAMRSTGNIAAVIGVSGLDAYLWASMGLQKLAGEIPSYCAVSDGTITSNYVIP